MSYLQLAANSDEPAVDFLILTSIADCPDTEALPLCTAHISHEPSRLPFSWQLARQHGVSLLDMAAIPLFEP